MNLRLQTACRSVTTICCALLCSTALAADAPFFAESFDDDSLHDRGWYDGDVFQIARDGTKSGAGCIRYRWSKGGTTPDSTAARRFFEPSESVYVKFYMRLSENWGWSGRDYHPHLINILTTENDKYAGPAATHLTLYIEPQNGRLRLAAQDIQNKDRPHGLTQGPLKGGYNGLFYDSEIVLFDDADWHCVEAEFRLNSLDRDADTPRSDGVARAWFDGDPVVDRDDLILRTTDFPNMRFNQLLLAPYFGPGLLPHAQTLWIDDLEVRSSRPEDVR